MNKAFSRPRRGLRIHRRIQRKHRASPSRNNRHNPVSHMEDVTSSNTRTHARTRVRTTPAQRREETESLARISQPRDPVDRARAAANATAFVFTGAAGGLPMRHVGLPQLAVFVRPLF